jgi:hypothetical protein
MLNEDVKPNGELTIVLHDEFGNIKETFTKNLVVNTGLSFITSRMIGTASAVASHMGVGTGNVAVTGTDTALGTQLVRVALTSQVQVTTTVSNDAVQYVCTFPAGSGTGAITEAGLFNAASAGTMLARTVFAVINKGALDSLTITWKITFS